jgi:fructose-bisphosphate aldolase class 1
MMCVLVQALNDHKVLLEGTLLKPNMVTAGQKSNACFSLDISTCLISCPTRKNHGYLL